MMMQFPRKRKHENFIDNFLFLKQFLGDFIHNSQFYELQSGSNFEQLFVLHLNTGRSFQFKVFQNTQPDKSLKKK